MALEEWADELTQIWGGISNGLGGNVKSYKMLKKRDFPEKIEVFPCALTHTIDVVNDYSLGSPSIDTWRGVTEFHLIKDTNKENLPDLNKFIKLIRNKAAANMQLNSKLGGGIFLIDRESGITGAVTLQYGDEAPHLGIIVNWNVTDNVSGEFQPSTNPDMVL